MLAQLDGGIAEESRQTDRTEKRTTVGPRVAAQHYQGSWSEAYTNKSLGDALFPTLEEALETEGLLQDISQEVSDATQWDSGGLKRSVPPGSLVRVTAMGSFFDTRYVASAFSGFASVNAGLHGLGMSPGETTPPNSKGKQGQGQRQRTPKRAEPANTDELESKIPDFPAVAGINGETLRAFIQISRGVFSPGLHINLTPANGVLISARLQEGRQYLDSEADILLARYGAEPQHWTLVGSIGSYGTEETELPNQEFIKEDSGIDRGAFAGAMNSQMRSLGRVGFVDLPQHPGFSLIPFAVYRSIPRPGVVARMDP
ncbi:hypothetical protein [Streptomyces sp. NPDC090131]|uniref:DUF6414 family protein n=1 Tax=Streptomyces sp. NPDC090131 TaxID=3365954 RepID=UPI003802540F